MSSIDRNWMRVVEGNRYNIRFGGDKNNLNEITTQPRTYPPFTQFAKKIMKKSLNEKKNYYDELYTSKKAAWIMVASMMLFLAISVSFVEPTPLQKTTIGKWWMEKADKVAALEEYANNFDKTEEYISFTDTVDKTKDMADKNLILKIWAYKLSKIPSCNERDNMLKKVDDWKEGRLHISDDELTEMKKGAYFSCKDMVEDGVVTEAACAKLLTWDDYESMKKFNIYLLENVIPEFREGTKYFKLVSDTLWKYHELDSHTHLFDDFRKHTYIYTVVMVYCNAEFPVFMMMYESFSFANIAAKTAQEIILDDRRSVYYEFLSRGHIYHTIALFMGYGMLYIPVVLSFCILYALFAPTNILYILHQRILSTIGYVMYLTQDDHNTSDIHTCKTFTIYMSFYFVLKFIRDIVMIIILIFGFCNVIAVAYVVSTIGQVSHSDLTDTFSVWHYEIYRMFLQVKIHLFDSYEPIFHMFLYYIIWTVIPFIFSAICFPCRNWLKRKWMIYIEDIPFTWKASFLRCTIVILINFFIWYKGNGQPLEMIWSNFFKSVLPITPITNTFTHIF